MEYCLLCLELNKDLLDFIETNSKQWEDLHITKVLEKHFWPMSSTPHPCSWICSICWQEVDNFHKFYMRIEEAHTNFGRIKLNDPNRLLKPTNVFVEDIKNISCILETEILIDQNELKAVAGAETDKNDRQEIDKNELINKDPLTKPIASRSKNIRQSKRKEPTENEETYEIRKERTDSNDYEILSDDNKDCSYKPDKTSKERKLIKEDDKFIAEHFKQMFCDLCDVPFENFNAMKKHFLLKHSINTGYLLCCNRKFYQRNHLVDHLQCHFNPDHFKCIQCGKILSDRKNLENHMLRVHRPEDIVAKFSCDICGKSFIKAYVLKTHKLKHLPEADKKFPCEQCGKLYASSYLLKIHKEVIHLKKQVKVCYVCGKTLPSSAEYKTHMNKHEGIPAPIINCDVCGLRLSCERSLKLHKESQHPVGGKKDHPCTICEKVSPSARALKKHINTMHEKGLDHKCAMCEKAFRRVEGLKEHMASHTGTPLYTCPWCPKTFNSNGNMHAHRKSKHPKEYLEQKLQKYL